MFVTIFPPKIDIAVADDAEVTENDDQAPKTPNSARATSHFSLFKRFLSNSETHNPSYDVSADTLRRKKIKEVEEEVGHISTFVASREFRKTKCSTKQFWQKNQMRFPHLSKLVRVLLNIPSSSAFIERFFNICGVICKKRSMQMKDDLIINRCLLKANMAILNELNEQVED